MKAVLIVCLAISALAGPQMPHAPIESSPAPLKGLNFNQVMDIIGGFFVGMSTDVNATDLAPCVTNSDVFGGWIEQAVVDFSKDTFDGIKDGMMDLSNAFGALPPFIEKCVPASIETAKVVEKAAVAWAHPLSLLLHTGENILVNGKDIFEDISKAMGDYQTGNWYDFGFEIGQASFKVIYVPESEMIEVAEDDVLDIVKGLMLALDEDLDVEACPAMPDVSVLLNDAASGFKLKTFGGAKDALTNLAKAVKVIITTVEVCICQHTASGLSAIADVMVEPYSFAYLPGKMMILNGRSIGSEVKAAVANLRMEQWNAFGFYLGKAMLNLA